MKRFLLALAVFTAVIGSIQCTYGEESLWDVYQSLFFKCRYVDLTHSFSPTTPVWEGFGQATFRPCTAGADMPGYVKRGEEFTYDKQGFISTSITLPCDQYGTHIDPPAHWDSRGATISDLPATFGVRPLVVIDIHKKVEENPGYQCALEDIKAWESVHGKVPQGSVVMIRSDWYKHWNDPARFCGRVFPGITLDALKFLHLERKILLHGHEPLDTDTTPTLEGEYWLMHNQFCQAEVVANLDLVPESGALVIIGFAKSEGGTGGIARFIAICPPEWPHGQSIDEAPGAPLPLQPFQLKRDGNGVLRPMNH